MVLSKSRPRYTTIPEPLLSLDMLIMLTILCGGTFRVDYHRPKR